MRFGQSSWKEIQEIEPEQQLKESKARGWKNLQEN